jgi:hypothetical protein
MLKWQINRYIGISSTGNSIFKKCAWKDAPYIIIVHVKGRIGKMVETGSVVTGYADTYQHDD